MDAPGAEHSPEVAEHVLQEDTFARSKEREELGPDRDGALIGLAFLQ